MCTSSTGVLIPTCESSDPGFGPIIPFGSHPFKGAGRESSRRHPCFLNKEERFETSGGPDE